VQGIVEHFEGTTGTGSRAHGAQMSHSQKYGLPRDALALASCSTTDRTCARDKLVSEFPIEKIPRWIAIQPSKRKVLLQSKVACSLILHVQTSGLTAATPVHYFKLSAPAK
jgi:hypothetical protein